MDFEEIDNLEEEQLNDMYNDVIDFGDEAHLALCCCASEAETAYYDTRADCRSWCRSLRSRCSGWNYLTYVCMFSC